MIRKTGRNVTLVKRILVFRAGQVRNINLELPLAGNKK